jgi:hypothetical protein
MSEYIGINLLCINALVKFLLDNMCTFVFVLNSALDVQVFFRSDKEPNHAWNDAETLQIEAPSPSLVCYHE